MGFSRRLQQVHFVGNAAQGWQWHGSMLDDMGGCMVANYDGQTWFTGSDIGGAHKLSGSITGTAEMPQYNSGRSTTAAGTFNNDLHKVAAIQSDGVTVYSMGGDGTNGGIHKRVIATDAKWTLLSTNFYGDVSGSIGAGRSVGSRRIHIDNVNNAVYVACQSTSDAARGGIAVSKNGGAFANFSNATTFAVGRMFRALQGSANWSDLLYASADNAIGQGAVTGAAPGVFVYTGASTAGPTQVRIDNVGTGHPTNADWKDMCVVDEGGKDALYITSGYADGASGGVWRCTINTDPNGWGGVADVTWVQLLSAGGAGTSGSPSVDYRNIYAYRSGASTYAIACNNPAQTAAGATKPASLSGVIPGTGGVNYVSEVVRSLNAHTASPQWDAITNDINVSPAATFNNVYNTSGATAETWLQEAGSMNAALNSYLFRKTVLGGKSHGVFDIDVDPINQRAVISGKQGAWIGFNVWDATLSNITWQPFSASSGNCTNHGVEIHPSNNLFVAHSDTDRLMYYNLEGGLGQDRGCAANFSGGPPIGFSTFIRQGGTHVGRLLIGDSATKIWSTDDWYTLPNRDTTPTLTSDAVTSGTGSVVAVGEWDFGGSTYRMGLTSNGGWQLKKDSGAWATVGANIGAVTDSTHGEYRVIANDGFKDCWVMVSSNGMYYCADISAVSPTFTKIWNQTASDQSIEGRIAQDRTTRTTLYVSWGKGFNGVWKLTGCDANTFTSSGSGAGAAVTPSGAGTATALTTGSLALTGFYGSLDVDPADGSMVVCEPGYTGIGDIHYASDGVTFKSVADSLYPDIAQMPNSVRKSGNRIYVGVWTSGTVFAVLQ